MSSATLDINYDTTENSILINDLAANGNVKAMGTPSAFVRAFLRGLIEEFNGEKDYIVVNTTCMSHIDPLETVGFTVVEEESEGHFVTALYEYDILHPNQTELAEDTE